MIGVSNLPLTIHGSIDGDEDNACFEKRPSGAPMQTSCRVQSPNLLDEAGHSRAQPMPQSVAEMGFQKKPHDCVPVCDAADSSPPMRCIRSFVRRGGASMRPLQEDRWQRYAPSYVIEKSSWSDGVSYQDVASFFDPLLQRRYQHYAMEIGFGDGAHLAYIARHHSNIGYIGCDPHRPGVHRLLNQLVEQDIHNVRMWPDDVWALLPYCPDRCFLHIYVLYPDPWPKKRHHKRRLMNHQFLDLCHRKLAPSGVLHVATDHRAYAEVMDGLFAYHAMRWKKIAPDLHDDPILFGGIKTRYQTKALDVSPVDEARGVTAIRSWCMTPISG